MTLQWTGLTLTTRFSRQSVAPCQQMPDQPLVGTRLRRVAVLSHPRVPAAQELVPEVVSVLQEAGVVSITGSVWGSTVIEDALTELDACFVLGGDGSLLRVARMTAAYGVPIVGINLGRLGFLSEIEPAEILQRVP